MNKWLIVVIIILGMALGVSIDQNSSVSRKLSTALANIKAYDTELSGFKEKSVALELTIGQLETFQDSILRELDGTRKELGIKSKRLQSLQYVKSGFTRTDTLVLRDTLFREPSLAVDTTLGDSWYSVRIGLEYPSAIAVTPEFRSEKHIVVSTRRETVNPPKKFFLLRWLQKKHSVLQVDVVEKNPYVEEEYSRFIEIVR